MTTAIRSSFHLPRRLRRQGPLAAVAALALALSAVAPRPALACIAWPLYADPNPVLLPLGQSQGTTTVHFKASGSPSGYVALYVDHGNGKQLIETATGGPDTPCQTNAEVTAPVYFGEQNLFEVYDGSTSNQLSWFNVTVQHTPPPLVQVPPATCGILCGPLGSISQPGQPVQQPAAGR